ncbi:MAG TPA: PLP-dependent aspartate aminotransferase family protein [Candidatus Cybelea sp.]|nr:PLP-dependent aspartate aminotransferase family protein [Candidatus Cybelea sp.]
MRNPEWRPASVAAQGLGWIEPKTGAISPPIHMSSTFLRDPDNQYRTGHSYIRDDNPAFEQVQALLTKLEGGAGALLFSSGMAAATSVFLALKPGDHVIVPEQIYYGIKKWLNGFAQPWGLAVEFVDMTDLDAVKRAVRPGATKLVWSETPANPVWSVTDLAAVAEIAHAAGARFATDSTVATPVFSKPLQLGVDIVMHSATKFLNGHSDLCAGALVTAKEDEFWARILTLRTQLGSVLGSVEAWLLLRGMRSLFPRVEHAARSAQLLAERLHAHPQVASVLYPGLPDFRGHAVAVRQMHGGFGAMLSIRVKGGEASAVKTAANVHLWKRATSLGGTESLIEHRASIEGQYSTTPKDLLRLSAGLEDAHDLYDDLAAALDTAHRN